MTEANVLSVGVVGLGAMGGALARRLIDTGFDVVVADLDVAAVQRLVEAGATAGDLSAAIRVDVVVLSLPTDAAVLDVAGQLAPNLSAGVLLEMSSVLPDTVRQVANLVDRTCVELVDVPVSGGPADALTGSLKLLVGADTPLSDTAHSVLNAVGTVHIMGGLGDGKIVKLINNMMAMGNLAVAVEAFQLGVDLGVDAQLLYDVISRSGGRSNHFNKRVPWVIADDFDPRFAVRLGEKDMRLALELAHGATYPAPVAATVHQVFEAAMARRLANEDVAALIKVYRR